MEVTNYYDSTEWIEQVERQYNLDTGWVSLTTGEPVRPERDKSKADNKGV